MRPEFNTIANTYDQTFSNTLIGKAQRDIVWEYLDKHLPVNPISILEINCGTGEDAIYLAGKGHSVLATDASPGMIHIVEQKISTNNLSNKIETGVWDLNNPFPFANKKFDLIFSNFGGLNCLSPDAINKLSKSCTELLNENGKLVFVVMGRFCLMETIYFLLKGKFKSAFRRSTKKPVKAKLGGGAMIDIWYYKSAELKKKFSGDFKYIRKRPVGLFVPPSYLENYFSKRKKTFRMFLKIDHALSSISFLSSLSDHYIIELHKA